MVGGIVNIHYKDLYKNINVGENYIIVNPNEKIAIDTFKVIGIDNGYINFSNIKNERKHKVKSFYVHSHYKLID